MIVVEAEHHKAFIVWDAQVAPYAAEKEFGWSFPCTGRSSTRRGASVEVHRRLGCEPQRAVLGGVKQPTATGRLSLVIPASGPASDLPQVASRSLSGAPFSAGLPDEEVTTVVSGLLYPMTTSGDLRVTSAAYDDSTSAIALLATAQVLATVLGSKGDGLSESGKEEIRWILRTNGRA